MVSAIVTSLSWCSVNVNIYIFMYVRTCSHSYILVRLKLHTSDWPVDCIWQPESKNTKLRKLPRILHWRKKKKKKINEKIEKQCHNQPTCHWVVKWSPKVFSTNSLMLPSWPSLRSHIKVSTSPQARTGPLSPSGIPKAAQLATWVLPWATAPTELLITLGKPSPTCSFSQEPTGDKRTSFFSKKSTLLFMATILESPEHTQFPLAA